MPPKPVSKKAKQKAAAVAMVAAASTADEVEDIGEEGVETGGAASTADSGTPREGLSKRIASGTGLDGAGLSRRAASSTGLDGATISSDSARDETSTVGTSATKDSALDAFLSESKGEDLHWRLMSQAMDLINITTSTYQSKIHPNSKDVALANVSLILKGRELVVDANITLNWGQRYGLLGANGEARAAM